jgi:hypothetical protein
MSAGGASLINVIAGAVPNSWDGQIGSGIASLLDPLLCR